MNCRAVLKLPAAGCGKCARSWIQPRISIERERSYFETPAATVDADNNPLAGGVRSHPINCQEGRQSQLSHEILRSWDRLGSEMGIEDLIRCPLAFVASSVHFI